MNDRRNFLKGTLALAAAYAAGGATWVEAAKKARKIPIGLQLYVVRNELVKDVPGTLKKVAALGYKGVEFYGYNGESNVFQTYSAAQLRQFLDENKLRCCGIHLSMKALQGDALARTIENNKTLGNRFLNVSSAGDQMKTAESIKGFAAFLNEMAGKLKKEKMVVGYHAHGPDFVKIDGQAAWDLLFSQTKPEVNMQLDIGNAIEGGGDPLASLKKFPGKVKTIHLKSAPDKPFDGDYFKEIFQICEKQNKLAWYIVEEGEAGGDVFDIAGKALETLKQLGK